MKSRAERRAQEREFKKAKKRLADGRPEWTPFQEAELPPRNNLDNPFRVVINSRYQVNFYTYTSPVGEGIYLSIKHRDKSIVRDWRDLQRIKNELLGPEIEACELFPAESRLVDTSNQYHLWCLPEGQQFPFGFHDRRCVVDGIGSCGSVQRPFDDDNRPADALSDAEMARLASGVLHGDAVSRPDAADTDD